jgi:AraC family transcriptional regulator
MAHLLGRMERAVALMADRVREGDTPSLHEMASAAAFSRFHFHRAYTLLTGETPGQTVQRLRAAHALAELSGGGPVTSAAFQAGYGSSQALAKALRKLGAAPASELRGDPERLGSAFETVAPPLRKEGDGPRLVIEAARTLPFEVLLTRHEGDPAALNGVYHDLFVVAGGAEGVSAILGFPHADEGFEPTATQIFDAAVILTEHGRRASAGARRTTVAAGTFLSARVVGDYDKLGDAIDHVVSTALVSPDLSLADRPVMLHYLDDPEDTTPDEQRADVYVPVSPLA